MILYNVTCLVNPEIEEEWMQWMKDEHLPEVMNTGKFVEYKMYKIDSTPGDSGISYSIQYTLESRVHYETYASDFGPGLKAKTMEKFGDHVQAFRTLMERVD
jgi:hypothetical protein